MESLQRPKEVREVGHCSAEVLSKIVSTFPSWGTFNHSACQCMFLDFLNKISTTQFKSLKSIPVCHKLSHSEVSVNVKQHTDSSMLLYCGKSLRTFAWCKRVSIEWNRKWIQMTFNEKKKEFENASFQPKTFKKLHVGNCKNLSLFQKVSFVFNRNWERKWRSGTGSLFHSWIAFYIFKNLTQKTLSPSHLQLPSHP